MEITKLKKWFKSKFYISKLPLDKKEDLLNYHQAIVWLQIKFHCGEHFAINQQSISDILNSPDIANLDNEKWYPDKVRDVIRELRAMGFPILSSPRSGEGGYYTPATKKEVDEYTERSYRQARTIMWPIKRVKKGSIDWLYLIRQKTLPLKMGDFE